MRKIGRVNAPVHDGIAIEAESHRIPRCLCNGPIFCHATSREFGCAASDAIDLPKLTRSFVLLSAIIQKVGKDKHRTPIIAGWKPGLDPLSHGVLVHTEQTGNLFRHVGTVNVHELRRIRIRILAIIGNALTAR